MLGHAFPMGAVAGGSSQHKYDELSRHWRRRNRRLFIVLGIICTTVVLASFVAARVWPAHGWLLGFLGGGAMAFFVLARISPPGWIENWQSGAWGEQATAKVLRELEREGWTVLHDLPAARGNVDHIVIGPGGVFLLDSKRLSGTFTVAEDGSVTVHRADDPTLSYHHPGGGHLLALARETHSRIRGSSRINTWITPVMVLWADFPQRAVDGRCAYVHGDDLVPWLRARPQRIAPNRLNQVADAAKSACERDSPNTQLAE